VLQPTDASRRPTGARLIAGPDPEIVSSVCIHVQLRRNPSPLQSQVQQNAVLSWTDKISATVRKKYGRSTGWDV